MQITKNMINELNNYLSGNKCIFRFKLIDNGNNNIVRILPVNDTFIDLINTNIMINNNLIDYLDNYFMKYSINIVFNKNYTSFWSAERWNNND